MTIFNQVSHLDKLLFSRHLQTMIKSGIPLGDALDALVDQGGTKAFEKILSQILTDVKNGSSLSDAFKKHPRVFSNFYVNMIAVGENSGSLDETLAFLTHQIQKDFETKRKVQTALLYPTLVLVTTIVVGSSIGFFVLPRVSSLFSSFQTELPISTKILLFIAKFMDQFGLLLFLMLILSIVGLFAMSRIEKTKAIWDELVLKIPFVGVIIKYSQLSRMSRNLGTLIQSGVPISKGIMISSKTLDNAVFRTSLVDVYKKTEAGEALADSFKDVRRVPIYPAIVYKMVAVGEKTGNLDEVFFYLSDYYEAEIDSLSKSLTSILEPVLLLVLGLIVGFMALAVVSPIYQFAGSVSGG